MTCSLRVRPDEDFGKVAPALREPGEDHGHVEVAHLAAAS